MFKRFTDRCRKAVALANMIAQRQGCGAIDAEHVLMGMIVDGEGVGVRVLKRMGVDVQGMLGTMGFVPAMFAKVVEPRRLPQTRRFRDVVERAIKAGQEMGDEHVGTEHLLLGLLGVGDGKLAEVLRRYGVTWEAVVERIGREEGRGEERMEG